MVSDVFVYGSLRHGPLLQTVLGRTVDEADMAEAALAGHGVFEVVGQSFPLLQAAPGQSAAGLLLRGLSAGDLDRLTFYEGVFAYDPHPQMVRVPGGGMVEALVFLPRPGEWQAGAAWSLEGWANRWGAISARAAVEIMDHFGRLSPQEVARRQTGIMLRAAAWVAAQARPADPEHDLTRDVVVHAHYRRYSNFFAAEEMDLQYRRFDGALSPVLNRGAQVLGQAAVVLPYDPRTDAVMLVQQFRTPLFIGGDRAPWLWEPVSGLIDPGETAAQTARREAMEEAGLHLSRLEPVSAVYSSSGACSEFVHLFVGLADFSARRAGGGLAEEGEDIRLATLSYDELMQGVDRGEYRDMPLLACALWLARHRDRLRAAA